MAIFADFKTPNKLDYPKLMKVTGDNGVGFAIVLMTDYGKGTLIAKTEHPHVTTVEVGDHNAGWSMEHFETIQGDLILRNE